MPDSATLVTHAEARRGTWGTAESGHTVDWIYFLTDEVCQIVFGLLAGSSFTQTEDAFDVFERDTVWHVLSGCFVAANPETGEVHRLNAGDSLVFRGDVWHHGFDVASKPVFVMEFTSPPPTRPDRFIERRDLPSRPAYGSNMGSHATVPATASVVEAEHRRWRLEGAQAPVLVGEIVATPGLTVGEFDLRPGQQTDVAARPGAQTFYVLAGTVAFELPDEGRWLEAARRDGVYLPAGTPYRLLNVGTGTASVLFQRVA